MSFRNLPDDGEAESGAGNMPGLRPAIEALEDAAALGLGNRRSGRS